MCDGYPGNPIDTPPTCSEATAAGNVGDELIGSDARMKGMSNQLSPQRVPVPRRPDNDYTREAAKQRTEFLRERTGVRLEHVASYSFDPASIAGNVEQFVGAAQVPLGIAGPLLVDGEHSATA
jgi:hydroxymethylglutaryl-CoA reductase